MDWLIPLQCFNSSSIMCCVTIWTRGNSVYWWQLDTLNYLGKHPACLQGSEKLICTGRHKNMFSIWLQSPLTIKGSEWMTTKPQQWLTGKNYIQSRNCNISLDSPTSITTASGAVLGSPHSHCSKEIKLNSEFWGHRCLHRAQEKN